jgi:elongation factor P hydroxylase
VQREAAHLIEVFDRLFVPTEQTRLVRGAGEPLYRPRPDPDACDEVVFAHGFFASALHEIAHWCVAGRERRRLMDYGYWYKPDGRTAEEQREFEQVEVRPQALEWIFSTAAGVTFHFSADNLGAANAVDPASWARFQQAVAARARTYVAQGLPARARLFATALAERYGTGDVWQRLATYAAGEPLSAPR